MIVILLAQNRYYDETMIVILCYLPYFNCEKKVEKTFESGWQTTHVCGREDLVHTRVLLIIAHTQLNTHKAYFNTVMQILHCRTC